MDTITDRLDIQHSSQEFAVEDAVEVIGENSEAGAVLGTLPISMRHIPGHQCCYYFEIKLVRDLGSYGIAIIGFAERDHNLDLFPGLTPNSYGYSSDGHKAKAGNKPPEEVCGEDYGESWYDVDDVVGAGFIFETQEIFFTKNGQLQGIAFTHVPLEPDLYPAIGLYDVGVKLDVNFGRKKFQFDLEHMLKK